MKVGIQIALKSVVSALEQIHVLGKDAELLGGAIRATRNVIAAIDEATKEEQDHEDHDEQREDV